MVGVAVARVAAYDASGPAQCLGERDSRIARCLVKASTITCLVSGPRPVWLVLPAPGTALVAVVTSSDG